MDTQQENNSIWQRILFIVLFAFASYIAIIVTIAIVVAQCGFALFTDKPNEYLTQLGDSFSKYIAEILRYMTFNTDHRPFPFSDFPKSDVVVTQD